MLKPLQNRAIKHKLKLHPLLYSVVIALALFCFRCDLKSHLEQNKPDPLKHVYLPRLTSFFTRWCRTGAFTATTTWTAVRISSRISVWKYSSDITFLWFNQGILNDTYPEYLFILSTTQCAVLKKYIKCKNGY